jgi:hypothetical protein
MPVNKTIKLRRDTSTNWTSVNPILSSGEGGLETDTNNLKYGNGTTHWNDLSYFKDLTPYVKSNITFVVDGGISPITTGDKAWVRVPFNEITSDISGSCIVTVGKSTYNTFPSFLNISGTEKPTLISSQKNKDIELTTWNTIISIDDYLRISVDSTETIKKLIVSLLVDKTA